MRVCSFADQKTRDVKRMVIDLADDHLAYFQQVPPITRHSINTE